MSSSNLSMFRNLIRELRITNHTYKSLFESPVYQYVEKQYRKHMGMMCKLIFFLRLCIISYYYHVCDYQVTDKVVCRANAEGRYLAETYHLYLQSTRKASQLRSEYHVAGERSVRETADMVGFFFKL